MLSSIGSWNLFCLNRCTISVATRAAVEKFSSETFARDRASEGIPNKNPSVAVATVP